MEEKQHVYSSSLPNKRYVFWQNTGLRISYGDEVTITPRNYPLKFRHIGAIEKNYAILGMAHVVGDYPLYYDAINEKGLGMAGLNFVGNAVYQELSNEKKNVAQYEFILWILRQCATVQEAKDCLVQMQLVGTPFHESLPTAQLHWMMQMRKIVSWWSAWQMACMCMTIRQRC